MPHVANFLCNRKSHPHFPDRFDLVTWPSLEQHVSVSLHSMAPPLPTWPALKCARVLGGGGRGEDHALTRVGSRVGAGMTAAGPGLLAPAGTCACLVVSFSSLLVRLRKAGGLQGSSALSPRPPCPWVFVFCHL